MKAPDGVPKCILNTTLWNSVGIAAGAILGAAVCAGSSIATKTCSGIVGWIGLGDTWVANETASGALIGAMVVALACAVVPGIDDSALYKAEARILEEVSAAFDHNWVEFRAAAMDWQIHCLRVWDNHAEKPPPATDADTIHLVVIHGHSSGSALFSGVMDQVLRGIETCKRLAKRDKLHHEPITPSRDQKRQKSGSRDSLAAVACVWLVDMPGWGRSPAPDGFTAIRAPNEAVTVSVAMLHGWMKAQGLGGGNTVLLGHSIGGLVAAQFAETHPTMLRQLILAAPAGLLPAAARQVPWTLMMRFLPPQVVSRVFGRALFLPFKILHSIAMPDDWLFANYYYSLAYCTTTRGMADRVWAGCVDHDWMLTRVWWKQPALETVMGITVPLTLLWGQDDALFPASHAALFHQLRPDVDVYVVEGAGHNPLHDDGNATAAAIVDAIASFGRHRTDGHGHSEIGSVAAAGASSGVLLPVPQSSSEAVVATSITGKRVRVLALPEDLHLVETRATLRETHTKGPPLLATSSSLKRRASLRASWTSAIEDLGAGRCRACESLVELKGHEWHCRCGSWTFASEALPDAHSKSQHALALFLTDLHVSATFDATRAKYLKDYFHPRDGGEDIERDSTREMSTASVLEHIPDHVHGHVFLIASAK